MLEVKACREERTGGEDSAPRSRTAASVLVAGGDTGGRFALLETVEKKGAEPPLHLHIREDELMYVLEGEVTFLLGGELLPRGPGGCVLLPRGSEHTFSVESDEARLLVLVAPAGLEGFYRELDGGGTGADPSLERLATVAARYGVEITGPPPGTG